MSCNSAIYTVNQSQVELAANSQIAFGSAIRRYGRNISNDGQAIALCGSGYYDVEISCTLEPTAAGPVTVQLFADGQPVPGGIATGTAAAAADSVNLCVNSLVRIPCCDSMTVLTLSLGAEAATPVNVATVVKKV